MKFIDFFAGVGGFRRGMEMAGHECVGFCEWDKFATASYTAMHLATSEQLEYLATLPKNKRVKEILKDEYKNGEWFSNDVRFVNAGNVPRADCFCFGAPCQDFSIAGQRKGLEGNRSVLVNEIFRIVEEIDEEDRPEWLIYENVKGMFSSNGGWDYAAILHRLDKLGYDAEWQLFNSKYYIPQNRERIYTIGHNRRYGTRQILPIRRTNEENYFPVTCLNPKGGRGGVEGLQPSLQNRIYDAEGITPALTATYNPSFAIPVLTPSRENKRQQGRRFKDENDPAFTLTAQDVHGVAIQQVGKLSSKKRENPNRYRVYSPDGIAPTLHTMDGGGQEPHIIENVAFIDMSINGKEREVANTITARYTAGVQNRKQSGTAILCETGIKIKEATKNGYTTAHVGDAINLSMPNSTTRRGRVGKGMAQTLDTQCKQAVIDGEASAVPHVWYEPRKSYVSIRRLTPRECFRLQGWMDEYFDRAELVNSDSQLYKQAGNGVTVPVVYDIARRL